MMKQIIYGCVIIVVGFTLDLVLGDPKWLRHPVVLIGKLISVLEKLFRSLFSKTENGEKIAGFFLATIVPTLSFAVPFVLLIVAQKIDPLLCVGVQAFMCYQILATKSLKTESMAVYYALKKDNLSVAKNKLSRIVGRDTDSLTEEQISKATIETVAENTNDGVVAPMLFMAVGGAPLGFFYKAINTLDSMVGYKNEKYLFFGRMAAKFDDFANFLPSRISAMFMILASFVIKLDFKNAWKIFKRDRFCHSSPNSAQTESVCSGALGIQLGGDAYYFGKLIKKPTIGDESNQVTAHDISLANKLMYTTAVICLIVSVLIRAGILAITQIIF